MLLGNGANGQRILYSVLVVGIYRDNDDVMGKIVLNIVQTGFDSLTLACVFWMVQDGGASAAIIEDVAAAIIAAVIHDDNQETGVTQIAYKII